jgi:thiamine-monophosphate kinase
MLVASGVKCAMDISDGLIADLQHICDASHAGAIVNTDAVPVHPAVKTAFGNEALDMAISGGEDYELLFTAGHDIMDKIKKQMDCQVTVIGKIVADDKCGIILKDKEGNLSKTGKTGWNHFGR